MIERGSRSLSKAPWIMRPWRSNFSMSASAMPLYVRARYVARGSSRSVQMRSATGAHARAASSHFAQKLLGALGFLQIGRAGA